MSEIPETIIVKRYKYTGAAARTFALSPDNGGNLVLEPGQVSNLNNLQAKKLAYMPAFVQLINNYTLQEIDLDAIDTGDISVVSVGAAKAAIAMTEKPSVLANYARNANREEIKQAIANRVNELIEELQGINNLFPKRKHLKQRDETVEEIKAKIQDSTPNDLDYLLQLAEDKRASIKSAAIARLKELGLSENGDSI